MVKPSKALESPFKQTTRAQSQLRSKRCNFEELKTAVLKRIPVRGDSPGLQELDFLFNEKTVVKSRKLPNPFSELLLEPLKLTHGKAGSTYESRGRDGPSSRPTLKKQSTIDLIAASNEEDGSSKKR